MLLLQSRLAFIRLETTSEHEGLTTVFPRSSSKKPRAEEVYDMVSVPCNTTNASKVA